VLRWCWEGWAHHAACIPGVSGPGPPEAPLVAVVVASVGINVVSAFVYSRIFRSDQNLFCLPRRSRVDKEDTAGAVHAVRLAHDLEPAGGRNLGASPRPPEPPEPPAPTQQGPLVRHRCSDFILFHVLCLFFLYCHLKSSNKRHFIMRLSSYFLPSRTSREAPPPPPQRL